MRRVLAVILSLVLTLGTVTTPAMAGEIRTEYSAEKSAEEQVLPEGMENNAESAEEEYVTSEEKEVLSVEEQAAPEQEEVFPNNTGSILLSAGNDETLAYEEENESDVEAGLLEEEGSIGFDANSYEEESASERIIEIDGETDSVFYSDGISNDELLHGYLDEQLFSSDLEEKTEIKGRKSRTVQLIGNDLIVYNYLKEKIADTAKYGGSTEYILPLSLFGVDGVTLTPRDLGFDADEVANDEALSNAVFAVTGFNLDVVMNALRADCPYELYWYDKTAGTGMRGAGASFILSADEMVKGVIYTSAPEVSMCVSSDYCGEQADAYTVSETTAAAVQNTINGIISIIDAYYVASDYEKLDAYRTEICSRVSYNHAAADDANTPYGDPWQLIYVFDGDDSTNVVCEGYSKAFQYLCDLSSFNNSNVRCISVSGMMYGGTGAGSHMWNVVKMDDGQNYLVDITNCDAGSIGADKQLFLVGTDSGSSIYDGYTFDCEGASIRYTYDEETFATFTEEELTLSGNSNYDPENGSGQGGETTDVVKLTLDTPEQAYLENSESVAWFSFIPDETDYYIFRTMGFYDYSRPMVNIYDENMSYINAYNIGTDNNFYAWEQLEEGRKYYFEVTFYYDEEYWTDYEEVTVPVMIEKNPIISITVDDVDIHDFYGENVVETFPDEYGNPIEFNWVWYENGYIPTSMTVETERGTFSGSLESVQSEMEQTFGYPFYCQVLDRQGYDNWWTYDRENIVLLNMLGVEAEYHVHIIPGPIDSISVDNVVYRSDQSWQEMEMIYDGEQEIEDYYTRYPIEPSFVTVLTKDGETFFGNPAEVQEQLYNRYQKQFPYSCTSDQSYSNQWYVGNTYEAYLKLGGVTAGYQVEIIESISEEAIELVLDQPVELAAEDVDGTVFRFIPTLSDSYIFRSEGDEDPRAELYNEEGSVLTDDDNGGGSLNFSVCYWLEAGKTYYYRVNLDYISYYQPIQVVVTETPVESVIADDTTVFKENAYMTSEEVYDPETGDVTYSDYLYYGNYAPKTIAVTMKDGEVIAGKLYDVLAEIKERYGVGLSWLYQAAQDQNYYNQWETGGSYTCVFDLGGLTAEYSVRIGESLITSVIVPDIVLYESEAELKEGYNENNEKFYWPYFNINIGDYDVEMTVNTVDGSFTGHFYEVVDELARTYNLYDLYYYCQSDQSSENLWSVGNHKAELWIKDICTEYNVTILPGVIASVEAEDVVHYAAEGTEEEIWIWDEEAYNQYSVYWTRHNSWPGRIKVTTVDGNEFSGDPYDVVSWLRSNYDGDYDYQIFDGQSYDNRWEIGKTYQSMIAIGGIQTSYNVTIAASPIQSIAVEDVVRIYNDGEIYTIGAPESESWIHYYIAPERISLETVKGSFSGTLDDAYHWFVSVFGYYPYNGADDPQDYYHQYSVGTYEGKMEFDGVIARYNIIIQESPVSSVSAESVILFDDIHKNLVWDETSQNEYYRYYNYEPKKITVTMGLKTYEGSPDSVSDKILSETGIRMGYRSVTDQSYLNQWGIGNNTAEFVFGGVGTSYNVEVQESFLNSVSVDDVTVYEGEQERVSMWNEELDDYDEYMAYSPAPQKIHVTTSDNRVYDGDVWSVYYDIQYDYNCYNLTWDYRTNQSFNNVWEVNHTYEAEFILGTYSSPYNVIVAPNPIESIAVEDQYTYTQFGQVNTEWVYDGEGEEEKTWTYYPFWANKVTVVMKDGNTFSGSTAYVSDQLSTHYNYHRFQMGCTLEKEQSWRNEWQVGETRRATLSLGGFSAGYNVTLVEGPIVSVSVEDMEAYEGGVDIHGDYYRYDTEPKQITVNTVDGKVFAGTFGHVLGELGEEYGHFFSYEMIDDQSEWNRWEAGQHKAVLILNGFSVEYNFLIKESPILEITVEDLHLFEGEGEKYTEDDGSGSWIYYYEMPHKITLITEDGEYTGDSWEVHEFIMREYGIWAFSQVDSDQYTNHFTVGINMAEYSLAGKSVTFNVIIEENPIQSIEVDDVVRYEDIDGYTIKETEDGITYESTYYDDIEPNYIRVTVDGKIYSGTLVDVANQFEEDYSHLPNYNYYASQDGTWKPGDHTAILQFAGFETEYNVHVKEALLDSFTADDLTVYENEGYEESSYYWDGEKDVLKKWVNYPTEKVHVTATVAGTVFEGPLYSVARELAERYKPGDADDFMNYCYTMSEQGPDNQWEAGNTYEATVRFGTGNHIRPKFNVTLQEGPVLEIVDIEAVTMFDTEKETDEYWQAGDGVIVIPYERFNPYPRNITVNTIDGMITGSPWQVRQQINKKYGIDINEFSDTDQSPDNLWGLGEHTATFHIGKLSKDYKVTIIENPIASIEVDGLVVFEGDTVRMQGWEIDEAGNETEVEWNGYQIDPQNIIVRMKDGNEFSGSPHEVADKYDNEYETNVDWSWNDSQWYGNEWGLGEYHPTFSFNGFIKEYEVMIIENPIVSVEAEDVVLQNDEYDTIQHYDETTGEISEWNWYAASPENITVTYMNPDESQTVVAGTIDDVIEVIAADYNCRITYSYDDDQSYENQWGIGNHQVTLRFAGKTAVYQVSIAQSSGKDIEPLKAAAIPDQVYTGKAITPSVQIMDGTKVLVQGTDYTVAYNNNTEPGTAQIVLNGRGNYTGRKTVTFRIKRVGWYDEGGEPHYYKADGTMLVNGWAKNTEGWYWMDADGKITKSKWIQSGGSWYYLGSNGIMLTGWQKIGASWYYMNNSGVMQTGWQQIGGKWYYFNSSGAMLTGWQQIGGKWYYFNSSGAMLTGWQQVSSKWYYFNSSGEMLTGWQQVSGKWYYFNGSGEMLTGWQQISGKWYYFNSSGEMLTGWQQIGGKWYYFNSSGAMLTGWQQISSKWYYFNSSGAMLTGWQQIGGKWYYFNSSGAMLTGTQTIGGKTYSFNSSGVWIS